MTNNLTYNARVFLVEDEDQRDQCQFVYVPRNGETPTRCQKDGIYRIGLTIFLCGIHMPGFGRNPNPNPIQIKKPRARGETRQQAVGSRMEARLLEMFQENIGETVPYDFIQELFPSLSVRGSLQVLVSRLRKEHGARIVNVTHVGYRFLGLHE
jgi:hypothetical protein